MLDPRVRRRLPRFPRERSEPMDPLETVDAVTKASAGEKEQIIRGYRTYRTLGPKETDPNFRWAATLAPINRPDGPDDDLITERTLIIGGAEI